MSLKLFHLKLKYSSILSILTIVPQINRPVENLPEPDVRKHEYTYIF